jgi:hypothetical protein
VLLSIAAPKEDAAAAAGAKPATSTVGLYIVNILYRFADRYNVLQRMRDLPNRPEECRLRRLCCLAKGTCYLDVLTISNWVLLCSGRPNPNRASLDAVSGDTVRANLTDTLPIIDTHRSFLVFFFLIVASNC